MPTDTSSPPIRALNSECDVVPTTAAIDRALRAYPDLSKDAVSEMLAVVLGRDVGGVMALDERTSNVVAYREKLRQLLDAPGIAQRTPAWYDARKTMITASDIAQALGCAKFGTQRQFYEKKCGPAPAAFDATIPPLRWGIMFEPVACQIYSCLNRGITVHDFGLLRHPCLPHIGASPDGITDDGIMIEIKCPWRRKINGEVPLQYFYQIQGQLSVCELDECDYFECEFEVVACAADVTYHDGPAYERGVFLEIVDSPPRYLYPPSELSSLEALEAWADAAVIAAEADGEGAGAGAGAGAVIVKRIWWRLLKCATARIHADQALFADIARQLEPVWQKVLAYRSDPSMYEAEVAKTAASASSSSAPSIKRRNKKKICTTDEPALLHTYAFIDLEEGEEPGGAS
jgi:putative phage-type endonuclease